MNNTTVNETLSEDIEPTLSGDVESTLNDNVSYLLEYENEDFLSPIAIDYEWWKSFKANGKDMAAFYRTGYPFLFGFSDIRLCELMVEDYKSDFQELLAQDFFEDFICKEMDSTACISSNQSLLMIIKDNLYSCSVAIRFIEGCEESQRGRLAALMYSVSLLCNAVLYSDITSSYFGESYSHSISACRHVLTTICEVIRAMYAPDEVAPAFNGLIEEMIGKNSEVLAADECLKKRWSGNKISNANVIKSVLLPELLKNSK